MHQIRGHIILEEAINKAKEQYPSEPRLVTIEKEVIAKYGSMFNPRDLDNLTAIDFKKFLSYEKTRTGRIFTDTEEKLWQIWKD